MEGFDSLCCGDNSWLFNYQTLIAGIIATCAAGISVYYIRKQIMQENLHREDVRRRQNISARAGMPQAISEVLSYGESCLALNHESYSHWKENRSLRNFNAAQFISEYPTDAFNKIQSIIESADDNDARVLLDFINWAQVHRARMHVITNNGDHQHRGRLLIEINFYSLFLDTLTLIKYAERIFPYARFQVQHIEGFCKPTDVMNTFTVKFPNYNANNELLEYIERHWPPSGLSEREL